MMRARISSLRWLLWLIAAHWLMAFPALAAPVTFTANVSEPVTVSGMPRIAINVGGVTGYASFTSSTGSAMTFTDLVQPGDFDPDGSAACDAVQPTATYQPLLVNAGTIERLGTRPAVRLYTNTSIAGPSALPSSNEFTAAITAVERLRGAGSFLSPYRISKAWTVPINTPAVATFLNSASAGTRSVYVNGSLFPTGTGYPAASDTVTLGPSYGGHIAEFMLFPSSLASTSRQAVESSQGAYYGVTIP
jgi:hypothetical protein